MQATLRARALQQEQQQRKHEAEALQAELEQSAEQVSCQAVVKSTSSNLADTVAQVDRHQHEMQAGHLPCDSYHDAVDASRSHT